MIIIIILYIYVYIREIDNVSNIIFEIFILKYYI